MERKNNFDFLRLIFATLVIVSHSYPLTGFKEPLVEITDGQISIGNLSVDIFFIMSGFLIINSLKYSKTPQNYLWKRVLRLFPALFVVLVLTLILTFALYTGANLLHEKTFWSYLPNNLSLYFVQYKINHVFEDNIFPGYINGSLWSLSYEFTMYIFILLLFPIKNYKLLGFFVLGAFLISYYSILFRPNLLSNIFSAIQLQSPKFYRLSTYFLAGSLLTFINLKKLNTPLIKISLLVLIILSLLFNVYSQTSYLFLPLLTILVGLSYSGFLNIIPQKIGDISYGMYIYGFPVQQTLMHFLNLTPIQLMVMSIPVAAVFSYFSWTFIEKKCMNLKSVIK